MRAIDADKLYFAQRYARVDPDSDRLTPVLAVDKYQIDNAPTIEVALVVHGQWIPEYKIKEMYYSPDDIERYKIPNGFSCSMCAKWSSAKTDYCPNCGARMDL